MSKDDKNGEKTKTCPKCGGKVLKRRARCENCRHCFTMLCEGCGRDVVGHAFCPECIESGIYHFQRN